MALLIRDAHRADGTNVDVRCADGVVAALAASLTVEPGEDVLDAAGMLIVPALCEPHAHLDKAFLAERIENPSGDLIGAIGAMTANRHALTHDDIVERAERAARLMAANGVTAIRTHADTTREGLLESIIALAEVRRRVADVVDIEIVSLITWPIAGAEGADNRALLVDALEAGADLVGGCPHLDVDAVAATEALLAVAAEHGRGIDLHTDESLHASSLDVLTLADRVISSGFPHRVTASHCCSLGVQDEPTRRRVSERVAEAGMSVIALPQTNLFLQGRDHPIGPPRGVTAVHDLHAAGAIVAAGADNLQDPFNPIGRGDPLEIAALMAVCAHVLPGAALDMVSSRSRAAIGLTADTLAVGAPADFTLIPATTARDAIATQPTGRMTIRRGLRSLTNR